MTDYPKSLFGDEKIKIFYYPTIPSSMLTDIETPRIGEFYRITLNDGEGFVLRRIASLWRNPQDLIKMRNFLKTYKIYTDEKIINDLLDAKVI